MHRHIAAISLLVASLGSSASAQSICHAENDGSNFNDLVSMGGPNLLLGVRFVAPANLTCTAIEVFTGEESGLNSVAIWSHDAVNNEPDTQSGVGTWAMSATNSWQGASLGPAVALTGGQTYWMVWGCQDFAQASVDVPMAGLGQPYRGSFDNGNSWSGPFQFNDRHWKFRLLCGSVGTPVCFGDGSGASCGCGNDGGAGEGCANSLGNGAILAASGGASVSGDTLVLAATRVPNQPGVFFQGDSQLASPPTFGDGIRCCGTNIVRIGTYLPVGNATDTATGNLIGGIGPPISQHPGNAGLSAGDSRCYQWWYRDPGASNPCGVDFFNLSNAVLVTWSA